MSLASSLQKSLLEFIEMFSISILILRCKSSEPRIEYVCREQTLLRQLISFVWTLTCLLCLTLCFLPTHIYIIVSHRKSRIVFVLFLTKFHNCSKFHSFFPSQVPTTFSIFARYFCLFPIASFIFFSFSCHGFVLF